MIRISIFLLFLSISTTILSQNSDKDVIDAMLVSWHKAAAEAYFDAYFGKMADDAVFIGTDATENWQNIAFRDFSKPYFDKGKAWTFTTLERNIYMDTNGDTAWFDEHLKTQMGICRGSGVVKKINGIWKVKHYVLSIAIPNENVSEITAIKKKWDSLQTLKMLKN
ncbi:nuclear transport factor 2 family protein [Dokdonia sp.]|uniref:nuclear transport factor 2 family protein n=1 Tax=Dokdonia sp. TaxID=2024995 RepID=UPI003263D73F